MSDKHKFPFFIRMKREKHFGPSYSSSSSEWQWCFGKPCRLQPQCWRKWVRPKSNDSHFDNKLSENSYYVKPPF